MAERTYRQWPFLDDRHRDWADRLEAWCAGRAEALDRHGEADLDGDCRALLALLAEGGWLAAAVPAEDRPLDVRTLCLSREILARHGGLADFVFAMQGLGSGPISLFGSASQKSAWLPRVARGQAV